MDDQQKPPTPTTTPGSEALAKLYELPFAEQLDTLRQLYMNGINDIMDHALSFVVLPEEKTLLAKDAAKFLVFTLVCKIAQHENLEPAIGPIMRPFRVLLKEIEREVPGQLREYLRAWEALQRGEELDI